MLASLLIVFREVIEAGLIVGIVLAATKGVAGRAIWVGYGVAGGVAGAGLVAAFAGRIAASFQGSGQEVFDASILLLAVLMLTWHNVWMAGHGRAMARDMKISRDEADTLAPRSIPLGRIAECDEVANLVTYLASDLAHFVNGTMIEIDGGQQKSLMDRFRDR